MPARVVVYTTDSCPYCTRARRLLAAKNVSFEEVDVTGDADRRRWLASATGRHTVPQVFINGVAVGGSDDLAGLNESGRLDQLLAAEPPAP